VRVNHAVIYPLAARPLGVSHVIAITQLYASHHFQTTLELRFLVDDERRADRKGLYLLSLTLGAWRNKRRCPRPAARRCPYSLAGVRLEAIFTTCV
jgi:hypothetical protein